MGRELLSKNRLESGIADGGDVADADVLNGMLSASNDACWCMEFQEPVDLTTTDREVVRQIFENGPVWRHCNAAMERLYQLPAGQNMNERPVHEVFPNNPNNQEFVRNLIANGFEVDGAPALDRRYDGLEIYVENDVRAHISNGKLYRMFGTVRNVGKHRRREKILKDQVVALKDIIASLPYPLIAVDAFGSIETVNSAAEGKLRRGADALVGQKFETSIQDLKIGAGYSELTKAMDKVRSLAIPVSVKLRDFMSDAIWQIAPRETRFGTGLTIMIVPVSASVDIQR
jgi:PAS domain-containing protein